MGDLIYSLPAIQSLHLHTGLPIVYQTSEYCRPALPLLAGQSFLHDHRLDADYRLEHTRYGCQPWKMAEPVGFSSIYHLGFQREILGPSILTRPLIDSFFLTLKARYDLELPPYAGARYLEAESPVGDYVAFQAHGDTFLDLTHPGTLTGLQRFWLEAIRLLGCEVIGLTGPDQIHHYDSFPCRVVCPKDLAETARIIAGARCFIGVQSVAAAIADGLKTPRLIFAGFHNALPTGPAGLSFGPGADPGEAIAALRKTAGF